MDNEKNIIKQQEKQKRKIKKYWRGNDIKLVTLVYKINQK